MIIYGQTKSQIQVISQELGYKPYHSKIKDQAGVIQQFQKRQSQVMAATSALGIGINISDIRYVIYIKQLRILLKYRQESRQVGQDRQISKTVIIHPDRWATADPQIHNMVKTDFQQVQVYIGSRYHRYYLDQYLDRTVNRYTQEQYQDQDIYKLIYNRYNTDQKGLIEPINITSSPSLFQSRSRLRDSRASPELGLLNNLVQNKPRQENIRL